MKNPLFSIITINLNTSKELLKTIKSVRAQSFKDYELVVIDGKSHDDSVNIIKNNRDIISRFISEPDRGRYDAMNKGIKLARGKYFLFLNSGDYLIDSDVLQNVSKYLDDDDLYFGRIVTINSKKDKHLVDFKNIELSLSFFREFALPHQAMFFSKTSFKKFGIYNSKYQVCADQEIIFRLFNNKAKIKYIPVTVSMYNLNGVSSNENYKELIDLEKARALDSNFGYPKIHFLTIVLYGEPFIRYHIEIFKKLKFDWHWHIVEGVSELKHDTSWSLSNGATIPNEFHTKGRSNDGTGEYLNELKEKYPKNITIYRKPVGQFWDGKIEMVNAPLKNIDEECILWQIDADEFWTYDQINRMREMYMREPDRSASYFMAYTFVGERLVLNSFNTYGNTLEYEWIRTWRYKPGDYWKAHEPPTLVRYLNNGEAVDVAKINPFEQIETFSQNLYFQHYSYVLEKQLKFKESYYAYKDAVKKWIALNKVRNYPILVKKYLDWIKDSTMAVTAEYLNIDPILYKNKSGIWEFKIDAKTKHPNFDNYNYLLAKEWVKRTRTMNSNIGNSEELLRLRIMEESNGWKIINKVREISNKIAPYGSKRRSIIIGVIKLFTKILK